MASYQVDQDYITRMVEKIPAFPQSVNRILEITASTDCSPKEVVSVIEHDPVLTMKLLKMVNSAYFGLAQEVSSVKQSVVYVGINTVKNVAITMATLGVLPKQNRAGLDGDAVWLHSLKVGVIARMVAQKKGVSRNDLASYFVAGLLHDIGKMVCAEYLTDAYCEVIRRSQETGEPFDVIERELIGLDHAEIGGLVAEKWQLPSDLIRAIQAHHQVAAEDAESPLVLAIAFANHAVHHLEAVEAVEEQDASALPCTQILAPEVYAWSGGVLDCLGQLPDVASEVEKAKAFINLSR